MKKLIRFAAAALSGITLLSAAVIPTGGARFDSVDSNTAVAGASVSLRNYLADGEGSADDITAALTRVRAAYEAPTQETEADVTMPETIAVEAVAEEEVNIGEILYSEPVIGVANVMSVLNVRKETTTLSDIVEVAVRGAEIEVIGEVVSNHVKWYKVHVNESEGYVAGNLVVFGDDAAKMQQIVEDENGTMPESFEITEDLSEMDTDLQERLDRLAKDISYVMRVDFPQNLEEEKYANTYSILVYLLELLTQIYDIANENGQTALATRVEKIIGVVEFNRQKLSEMTGYSDQDFEEMIADSKAKAEEERQAYIRAQQEADAARAAEIAAQQRAYEAELARQQAELAAQQAADEEARRKAEEELLAAQAAADQAAADVEAQAAAAQQAEADAAAQQQIAEQAEADARAQEEEAARQQAEAEAAQAAAAAEEAQNAVGRQMADFAASWVGRINYVYGGDAFYEGGGVDCSHFTYHVYLQYGLVGGYTTSWGQRGWGTPVAIENIQPGDLVCYDGHVAIYYGNGMIVHAPAPGRRIEIGSLYVAPVQAVRRLY